MPKDFKHLILKIMMDEKIAKLKSYSIYRTRNLDKLTLTRVFNVIVTSNTDNYARKRGTAIAASFI